MSNSYGKPPECGDGVEWVLIFRRYRTDPHTGERLDARKYGIKAWPIWVRKDSLPPKDPKKPGSGDKPKPVDDSAKNPKKPPSK